MAQAACAKRGLLAEVHPSEVGYVMGENVGTDVADGRKPPSTAAACRPLPSWKLNRICQEFIARHSGDEQRKYHAYAVLMQGHNLRPRPYEEWVANYRKAKERRVA